MLQHTALDFFGRDLTQTRIRLTHFSCLFIDYEYTTVLSVSGVARNFKEGRGYGSHQKSPVRFSHLATFVLFY